MGGSHERSGRRSPLSRARTASACLVALALIAASCGGGAELTPSPEAVSGAPDSMAGEPSPRSTSPVLEARPTAPQVEGEADDAVIVGEWPGTEVPELMPGGECGGISGNSWNDPYAQPKQVRSVRDALIQATLEDAGIPLPSEGWYRVVGDDAGAMSFVWAVDPQAAPLAVVRLVDLAETSEPEAWARASITACSNLDVPPRPESLEPLPEAPPGLMGFWKCDELVEIEPIVHDRDLDSLWAEVWPWFDDAGLGDAGGTYESHGVIGVTLYSLDEVSLGLLRERFESDELCVRGLEAIADPVSVRSGFRPLAFAFGSLSGEVDDEEEIGGAAIEVVTDQATFGALPEHVRSVVDVEAFAFTEHVLLIISAHFHPVCRGIVAAVDVTGSAVSVVLDDPGYRSCDDQGSSPGFVTVRVDRSHLPSGEVTFGLAHRDEVAVAVLDAVTASEPALSAADAIETDRGRLPAPLAGETRAGQLDDGTPVFVVRHDDDTVSVVDARSLPADGVGSGVVVSWAVDSRRFMGRGYVRGGAWDEYGRALHDGPDHDLGRFAAALDGDEVRIGQPIAGDLDNVRSGPLEGVGGRRVRATLPEVVSIDEARRSPIATVVTVDAGVAISDEAPARLCESPWGGSGCDTDGPPVAGFEPAREGFCLVLGPPVIVRRTAEGFTEPVTRFDGGGGGVC